MQKNVVKLEKEVDGKIYAFLCEPESPLPVVREVLQAFYSHCENVEKAILEKQKEEEVKEE